MAKRRPVLKLNEGDPSEQRLYYLPHYVAAERGFFADVGLDVVFTRTASGGETIRGGQIPAVLSGEADLTIGGPMVTMKMLEETPPIWSISVQRCEPILGSSSRAARCRPSSGMTCAAAP